MSERGGALSLDDCRCPVCLEIFIEPVTLPCTHTFCKACFLQAVDQASLLCPLCRRRISVWCRLNNRNNTLINEKLWTSIQNAFPRQCERRLRGQEGRENPEGAGQENPEDDLGVCFPRVCEPGELRQEYEEQVNKLTEERRALEEEEKRASEELIQRLLAEEEVELQEETKRRDEDERLARHLSTQLNSAVSQGDARPADATLPKKKKKEVVSGQIEKFLSPRPSSSSSSDCSFTSNKENILFPQLDSLRDTSGPPEEEQLRPGGGASCAKRKSQEMLEEEEEVMATKQVCVPSSSGLQGVAEWEVELLSRRQQEEEDRRLALLLQKELDQEERLKATDRRKGSSDAYPLRQDRRSKEEADRRTGHASSSSSSRTKQKTLTEMFSSLNN
ncbi:E3 ubiquitin-protein ligase rnf168 [Labrus mixtus]|uniref:E3 ubiquitin-protein ligase rnf168 n=1 Tax=Labrus mixtus TaxID=508554 RepID=UPI0029C02DE2|nr:E3 ubiquitin-protein ligase rnf168 [Labrus mixtus]XP_060903386.1 E3 ubiquitin-protein ligase rnf168 [Labrus mixtus]XP_060903387.1 E3 ubiquitin-protein ligase rnf168 [Labrus mixtus]XP_060903388.1 E3 ubiquitin-protein ligase rnf168 [Labrus mixtus]